MLTRRRGDLPGGLRTPTAHRTPVLNPLSAIRRRSTALVGGLAQGGTRRGLQARSQRGGRVGVAALVIDAGAADRVVDRFVAATHRLCVAEPANLRRPYIFTESAAPTVKRQRRPELGYPVT